jgi:hypothetical protein
VRGGAGEGGNPGLPGLQPPIAHVTLILLSQSRGAVHTAINSLSALSPNSKATTMIQMIRYHWKLFNLRRKLDKLHASYDGHKSKNMREHHEIQGEHADQATIIADDIRRLVSLRLVRKLERDFLPVPSDVTWEESHITGERYLSAESLEKVREVIRQEHRYKAERWQLILTWSIGLIGALTGLVSAFF